MAFPSPSVSAPSLSPYQLSFQGLTMGAGTPYTVTKMTGLDLPQIRSTDPGRPGDQGEFIGLDLYGGRDITIDFELIPVLSAGTNLQQLLLNLRQVFEVQGVTELPLYVQLPNLPLLCAMVRTRKATYPIDLDYSAAEIAKPVIQVHATDPRLYAAPTSTVTIDLPQNVTTGLTFPVTFPVTFGGGGGNQAVITNYGNTEMRPVLVVNGPCTNPTVTNLSISGYPALTFANPTQSGKTLASGQSLVVDLDFRTITFYASSGAVGSPRPYWLQPGSTWFNLPPGASTLEFSSGDSVVVDGYLSVEYASAYLL